MKKVKLVSFTLICTIIIQIFMPILMDIDWNAVFAENSGNKWDISKKGDGSVIAELSDDGTLTISGSGEMKDWNYNATTDWHTDENKVKVKEVIIKNGITNIGEYAFYKCSSLTNITIPKGVTSIEAHAFNGCSSLTNITIPEGVTSIEGYSFYKCSNLTNIIIPEGVTSIGGYSFYKCSNLTNIIIPEGVTSIGDYLFYECSNLTSITIPESITSIEYYAFDGCVDLTNITIPKGVTKIGMDAFRDCESLTSVTITEGVTNIEDGAFASCSSLTSIEVSPNNKNYSSNEGVLYTKDNTKIINYPEGKEETEYTILKDVTTIGYEAFSDCRRLRNITLPKELTSIGSAAFRYCIDLTNITIPEEVTSIGDYAFCSCSSLTNITIPEGVTSIKSSAFYGCSSLTSIIIPEGVTNIGRLAFYSCNNLTQITISESVTSIEKDTFYNCNQLKIYCKSNSYAKTYAEENKISYVIDDEAPQIRSIEGNVKEWTKNDVRLTINAEDNQSGLAYKAYSFDNRQTWQKENTKTYTENTNGIIIKVKDALGNIATYDSIDIDKILKINITDYEEITKENKKYITKITQNTTIQQLKEKIETNGTVKIYKGDNEITEEEALVGTGMTMQIENENYVLVVRGDINGDGKISLVDLANLKLSMVGKRTLNTASTMAGDINGDGNTSLNDLVKLKMYLVGKVNI